MIVNVYSQPACHACRLTKKRLFDLGIEFQEFDITEDHQAYEFVVNGLGVAESPVVAVFNDPDYTLPVEQWVMTRDHHWTGHRPEKITALSETLDAQPKEDDR